jgi:hypothetical protein
LLLDANRSAVPVRRKLGRIVGGKGRLLVAGERVHAIVCAPDWLRVGRYFFGMSENYYGLRQVADVLTGHDPVRG